MLRGSCGAFIFSFRFSRLLPNFFQYIWLGFSMHLMWRVWNMLSCNWYMMCFLSFRFSPGNFIHFQYLYDILCFNVALSFLIVFILNLYLINALKSFLCWWNFSAWLMIMLLQMLMICITNAIPVSYNLFSCGSCAPHPLCFWSINLVLFAIFQSRGSCKEYRPFHSIWYFCFINWLLDSYRQGKSVFVWVSWWGVESHFTCWKYSIWASRAFPGH
jgi:hypothetical protein